MTPKLTAYHPQNISSCSVSLVVEDSCEKKMPSVQPVQFHTIESTHISPTGHDGFPIYLLIHLELSESSREDLWCSTFGLISSVVGYNKSCHFSPTFGLLGSSAGPCKTLSQQPVIFLTFLMIVNFNHLCIAWQALFASFCQCYQAGM